MPAYLSFHMPASFSDHLSAANRPMTTVVLAMSADGKIADVGRSPARFGSAADKRHLEEQVAQADAVLFGAETLRAYGTTLPVTAADLQSQRQHQGKPPQPIQIVCSATGNLSRNLRFFQQPVPRWLLTTASGAKGWPPPAPFDRILVTDSELSVNWPAAFQQFRQLGIERLAILGGGELVAAILAIGGIDELYLTLCPVLLGGKTAPTPVGGSGFVEAIAPQLELLSVRAIGQEVFLHYRVR